MLFIAMYEASKRASLAAGLGEPASKGQGPASRECESANQGQGDTSSSGSRSRNGPLSHSVETTVSSEGSGLNASTSASSLRGGEGAADAVVDAVLPPWVLVVCSASSASLAGVLTHPADVVKTRLQVMGASSSSSSSSSSAGPSATADDGGDGRRDGGKACKAPVGGPSRPTARSVAADMLRREGIQVCDAQGGHPGVKGGRCVMRREGIQVWGVKGGNEG